MIQIEINAERIRTIGSNVRHDQMTTAQAEAFLTLHGAQLEAFMLEKFREFVAIKL